MNRFGRLKESIANFVIGWLGLIGITIIFLSPVCLWFVVIHFIIKWW